MRRWFITGVSSGLGQALALAALDRGDVVAGTVRTEQSRQEFSARDPKRAFGFACDVTDHAALTRAIGNAERAMDGIDVLVNNAGYSAQGTLEETPWDDIRAVFETNTLGPVAAIRAVLPHMRARRRGLIVNVSSLAGLVASPGVVFYGGAKLALESMSESLAQEVAPFGIVVMIVVPGAFRTDLGRNRQSMPDLIDDYAGQNADRRRRLAELSGSQRGDPAKAAAAILKAVDADPPPRRLVLGPDALDHIRTRLERFEAEMTEWEAISRGTDLADQ